MLTGGVSTGGDGFDPLGLIGGIASSLINGGVSSSGGGGGISGGAVAPSQMSYGPFGLLTKTLPGLEASPANATYAGQVQGYALNPPNIPTAQPMALTPMSLSLPGVQGYSGGGSPATNGGGGVVSTAGGVPSALGGGGPSGNGSTQIQSSPQQQQYDAGQNPLYAPAQTQRPGQPLQGGVSYNQPQQQPQNFPDWKQQVQALASGASDFVGSMFAQPAMAANRANTPSGMVPPPPPMIPSFLAGQQVPQMDPRDINNAFVPPMVPDDSTFGRAVERARGTAVQAGATIASQMFNNAFGNANDARQALTTGRKQLQNALKLIGEQIREPYQQAYKAKFETPIPQLGGATLAQYYNGMHGKVSNLNQHIENNLQALPTPQEIDQAERVLSPHLRGIAALMRGTGIAGSEELAQAQEDPYSRRQQAINRAYAAVRARAAEENAGLAAQRDHYVAQMKGIDAEYHAFTAEKIKVEDQIHQINKDALESYYKQADIQMSALRAAGNDVISAVQVEAANQRAAAQTYALTLSAVTAANAAASKDKAETRKIDAEMAAKAGQQEIEAYKAAASRVKSAADAMKIMQELPPDQQEQLRQMINAVPQSGGTPLAGKSGNGG